MELVKEIGKMKIDILGITETKRKGVGSQQKADRYIMFWSGVDKSKTAQAGVAFVINKERIEILQVKNINERIMVVKTKLGLEVYYFFVLYAPNENAKVEEKEKFFKEIQQEMDSVDNNNIIVMGDLNGRVGKDNCGMERWLGKEGEEMKNDNGKEYKNLVWKMTWWWQIQSLLIKRFTKLLEKNLVGRKNLLLIIS